jgi:hypothetical protein
MASEALKNIGTHVLLQLRIIEFDRLPNNVQPLLEAIKAAAMPISLDQVKETATYNNKNYYGGKELTFHDLNPFFYVKPLNNNIINNIIVKRKNY